ncbi:hypothetical protein H0H87_003354 [Tephrocybe sp. NHM501043]|nr:hypothetical protein H0H87_003354 [Tephrocybe sp. NHM501043]
MDLFMYLEHEFKHQRIPVFKEMEVDLGDGVCTIKVTCYLPGYCTKPPIGLPNIVHLLTAEGQIVGPESHTDNRFSYPDVLLSTPITCAQHLFGRKDRDSPEMWTNIVLYLCDLKIPSLCHSPSSKASFVHSTKCYFLHDDYLWQTQGKSKPSHLIVLDIPHQQELLATAHNKAGH